MRRLLGLALLVVACSSEGGGTAALQSAAGASAATAGSAGETSASGGTDGAGATTTGGANAVGAQAGEAAGATAGTAHVEAGTGGLAAAGAIAGGTGGTDAAGTGGSDSAGSDPGGAAGTACEAKDFYRDLDKDGFGDESQHVSACQAPAGYVDNADDCYDDSKDAHPGQSGWFTVHRGDSSFDYDCSGEEDLRWPAFSQCPEFDHSCPPPNTWPQGFSCDYVGMFEDYSEDDGWRRYQYSVCPPEPCSYASVAIPACGQQGRVSKPPISWDAGNSQYLCEEEPVIYNVTMAGPLRTQGCR